MTVCMVYGVLGLVSVIILALAEIGVEHNKNRAEVKHNIIFRPI